MPAACQRQRMSLLPPRHHRQQGTCPSLLRTWVEVFHIRQKLKTPMIAGSVCGGIMGIAWIIGFAIYFRKRYRRKLLKQRIAEGKAIQKAKHPKIPDERVIVPPDPAILLGRRLPGEIAVSDDNHDDTQFNDQRRQYLIETPRLKNTPYTSLPVASEEMLITQNGDERHPRF
ncbi:hypothetical protein C0993_009796 [Termitomyces sp. T159_Od127]|nr:hypothetical protein C0993_009796 [Termitomyces sp. T159_Od127]